jgi:hypothetical protein
MLEPAPQPRTEQPPPATIRIKLVRIEVDVEVTGADRLRDSRGSFFDPDYARARFEKGRITGVSVMGRKPGGAWTYADFQVGPTGYVLNNKRNPELARWIIDAAHAARQIVAAMTFAAREMTNNA